MTTLPAKTEDPGATIAEQLKRSRNEPTCFSLSWEHRQYYLPGAPVITLAAACFADGQRFRCVITDEPGRLGNITGDSRLAAGEGARTAWEDLVDRAGKPQLHLDGPLSLETVTVPKPWGREVWYTAIEERGVSRVNGTPLPWVISMAPDLFAGDCQGDPVLLKILDPLPDEVYGDLYFELHEEKTEVYVVTHIDRKAWPDGTGRIRFGFDNARLAQYGGEAEFKRAYLDAVRAYRKLRRRIDDELDRFRQAEGISQDAVVPTDRLEAWRQRLDPALNRREQEYRDRMNAFTALHPLEVGDVVQVHPRAPHALQHGVRVVEFQTPHYERQILSFAQKVLTQSDWDTEAAMTKVDLTAQMHPRLTPVSEDRDHRVDIIADFEQFQVQRIALAPGVAWPLPSTTSYAIVFGVAGSARLDDQPLGPEQACYIPAASGSPTVSNNGDTWNILLLASPRR